MTNRNNCGGCGITCENDQVCYEGGCESRIGRMLVETNKARAAGQNCDTKGEFDPAGPLTLNPYLTQAAQVHADDMAQNDFHGHTGSDNSDFVERIGRTNYAGQPLGENVAMGYRTPKQVVDAWVESDGHCANLMNPAATQIGLGYAYSEDANANTRWAQVFGREAR